MSDLLVQLAQAGSEPAFDQLVAPHRRPLHVHCYRMLGSFEDAEDAVQETFLRAWSRISTYAGTSTFRAWLYGIATHACLDALRRRKSRTWPTDVVAAANPHGPIQPTTDLPWLQPYPDTLLAHVSVESAEDAVVRRETIELAFLAAIQHLTPRQRAVLILRDVLAWSAKEVAVTLGMTPTAVNSALQRAHAALADRSLPDRSAPRPGSSDEQAVLRRFITAWESADVAGLAEMLAQDARLVMPPYPTWFSGRGDVLAFLNGRIDGFDHAHLGPDWRLLPAAANRQPAFGLYLRRGARFMPFATGVLQIGPTGIKEVALFMGNLANFALLDLPASA